MATQDITRDIKRNLAQVLANVDNKRLEKESETLIVTCGYKIGNISDESYFTFYR